MLKNTIKPHVGAKEAACNLVSFLQRCHSEVKLHCG